MNKLRLNVIRIKFQFWQNLSFIMTILAFGIAALLTFYPCILPENKELESVIAIVIGYIGLLYNLINYKIAHDVFFKELFGEFNSRFDKLNDALNQIFDGETKIELDGKAKSKETLICDYLNLCAEEYLWYMKGRVEPYVWKAWSEGMKYYLNNPHIKEVYHKQKEERNSYYGLIEELEKLGIDN